MLGKDLEQGGFWGFESHVEPSFPEWPRPWSKDLTLHIKVHACQLHGLISLSKMTKLTSNYQFLKRNYSWFETFLLTYLCCIMINLCQFMIYLMNLYVKGDTLGRECILAFFVFKVIALFVWAKLEKRGEERKGVSNGMQQHENNQMHKCCHKGVVPSPLTSILHM